jgi:membrane protein implicated in regulation of membrane protease activity
MAIAASIACALLSGAAIALVLLGMTRASVVVLALAVLLLVFSLARYVPQLREPRP